MEKDKYTEWPAWERQGLLSEKTESRPLHVRRPAVQNTSAERWISLTASCRYA